MDLFVSMLDEIVQEFTPNFRAGRHAMWCGIYGSILASSGSKDRVAIFGQASQKRGWVFRQDFSALPGALPSEGHRDRLVYGSYFTASAVLSAAFSVPLAVSFAAFLVACPVFFAASLDASAVLSAA